MIKYSILYAKERMDDLRRIMSPVFLVFLVLMVYSSMRSGAFSNPVEWIYSRLLLLPAVIVGISFHEFAHGWVAHKLGDPTPKMQKRLTINPIAHVDPIGLVALLLAGFGWGRPVEINPNNFKKRRRDEFLVSIAGVVMNLIIALITALIMKGLLVAAGEAFFVMGIGDIIWQMLEYIITINLVLMVFNLIPVPPLDGFSIITEIFNIKHTQLYYTIYNNGFFILMALILFGFTDRILSPAVSFFYMTIWNLIIM